MTASLPCPCLANPFDLQLRNSVLENLSYIRPVGAEFHERAPDAMSEEAVKGRRGSKVKEETKQETGEG